MNAVSVQMKPNEACEGIGAAVGRAEPLAGVYR
ncbi:MAG: hypothetical protein JWL71_1854 [Acidobacteria bacterium]|nr:hypothetical protein [Acidobacteriota bacterium]